MKTYRHFFFDFDGTIMDTSEGIFNAFDFALKNLGKETKAHSYYQRCIGPPLAYSFEHFLGFSTEDASSICIKKYREYYTPIGLYEVSVYDGIVQVLETLHNQGYGVYLATSKPQELAQRLLDKYGLTKYFTFVGGSDMAETRANKVQVIEYVLDSCNLRNCIDQCLMIGDRNYDADGAHKVGMDCMGILWGFGDRKEFEECGVEYIEETPSSILSYVQK